MAGGTYGFKDLEKIWVQSGGAPQYAPLMAGIALAESGGNPYAVNNTAFPSLGGYHPVAAGNSPEYSVGLWQINLASGLNSWNDQRTKSYGGPEVLSVPTKNAQAAINLLGNGSGLSNWSGDQAYADYRSGGIQAVIQAYGGRQTVGSPPTGPGSAADFGSVDITGSGGGPSVASAAQHVPGVKQAESLISSVSSAAGFFGKITQPNFLYRVGEIALGAALTLMGLYLLARQVGLAPGQSADAVGAAFDEGVAQGERAQARAAGRRSVANVPETASEPGRAARERRERIRAQADAIPDQVPF